MQPYVGAPFLCSYVPKRLHASRVLLRHSLHAVVWFSESFRDECYGPR